MARVLDYHRRALLLQIGRVLREKRTAFISMEKRMKDLSPLSVLKRGYSITRTLPGRRVLRDTLGVGKGDRVQVLLAKGALECQIEKVETGKNDHKGSN